MAQEVAGSIPVGHPELSRARRNPVGSRRPLALPLAILALALVGALAGYGLGTYWIASGSTTASPVPAQIEPVVTSPALPPRAAPASDYVEFEMGMVLVEAPSPPPPRQPTDPTDGEFEHVVSAGESLSLIAARYGVSVADIAAANDIADVSLIGVGQILTIPAPLSP